MIATTMRMIAFRRAALRRHRVVLEDLAFEHPDLHAEDAIGGVASAVP